MSCWKLLLDVVDKSRTAKLCLVIAFPDIPDIVKDCPKMRNLLNLPKKFRKFGPRTPHRPRSILGCRKGDTAFPDLPLTRCLWQLFVPSIKMSADFCV